MKILVGVFTILFSLLSNAETYKVAAYSWKPFIDNQRADGGLSIDLLQRVMQQKGHSIEVVDLHFARASIMFENQQVDILPAVWKSPVREKTMLFSQFYAVNRLVFIKPKGDNYEYTGLPSLYGKDVGIIRDYGYGEKLLNNTNIHFSVTNSLISNIEKVVRRRVDITLEDEIVANTVVPKELLKQVAFTKNAFSESPLFIACHKKNTHCKSIINDFNDGLKQLRESGQLNKVTFTLRDN